MKIRRLLIANRGEIARRILRTAHRLGIETVAVYSQPDANALHVREATLAWPLGGHASADSYLRADKILAAARATGADAVHPGYGFLSENADFAQAVADAGLTWIGPPPQAIRTLGNKSRAKQLAIARELPCLPGYQGEDQGDRRFIAEAQRIGFPVMVKAAAGGGGRGMRLVTEAAQLPAALQGARSEAQSAFGSGELLLERALLRPRHVEIQVFADMHGNCVHLGERDCSVQRRHQKLVEECPSPAVDHGLRGRMGQCAVELVRAAGYVGAGTVEFLLEDGAFWLMEVNTRLQVEHPVTEAVTGHDLVEWQLRVANGERLPCKQSEIGLQGHAIEVRLCAEDEHFTPQAGTVLVEPRAVQPEIAVRMELRIRHHDQVREPVRFGRQACVVVVADDVRADRDEWRIAEQRQRMLDAAAGFERFGAFVAVVDAQVPARSVAERGGELRGEIRGVDHDLAHAGCGEVFQVALDQAPAADVQQRFRHVVGQRPHAQAAAGREDHRAPDRHAEASSRGRVRSRPARARSSSAANAASSG